MRLPRRIPWASIAEFDQLCSWIYTDEHDLDSKVLAVNRLSAWSAITPLPHALESTLALLVVILQDKTAPTQTYNRLSLRQSYSAALIRLVNGLVDPLQLGAYARSVASIAAQLGLPGWLVELRHAATHEDLPSLELLREAAGQAMAWLLHNYFLPTINPTTAPQRAAPPLRSLGPILKQYKTIMKIITRDVSLRTRFKQEVNTVTRDIERWISEAKVTANIVVGDIGWGAGATTPGQPQMIDRDDGDLKERWALEKFCDVLLEKGGLVPLSKKKRNFPEDKFWPPQPSLALWAPLLNHVQILHNDLAYILCTRIIFTLLPSDDIPPRVINDPSYDICLARWVMWAIETWPNTTSTNDSTSDNEDADLDLKKDVALSLLRGLGHNLQDRNGKDSKAARALLNAICEQNPEYQPALELLTQIPAQPPAKVWAEDAITTMTDRLAFLLSAVPQSDLKSTVVAPIGNEFSEGSMDVDQEVDLPGWRQLDPATWKPCPIGVFCRS